MRDDRQISRRDWFRLQAIQTKESVDLERDGQVIGSHSPSLAPIPHPVNHDGMELSELPPTREALLAADQVRQLFADIEALASEVVLMQRNSRSQRATASRAMTREQLSTARDSLLYGNISRVQIRYQWEDAQWIDTLEVRNEEFRLVRIVHRKDLPRR